jgi:membrane protein implicated in regulation of membrane protease activity
MNAKPSDWLALALSMLGCALATVVISLMLNFTGDCGPGVERCGETARQLSFVVLALGMAALVYLVVRFIRRHFT